MDADYVEAIVLLSDPSGAPHASAWLAARGLSVSPMRAGLLISGDRAAFEAVFGVPLADAQGPVDLPPPAPLRPWVKSITIRATPVPHRR